MARSALWALLVCVSTVSGESTPTKHPEEKSDVHGEIVLTIVFVLILLFARRCYDGVKERYHFVERRLKFFSATTVTLLTGFIVGSFVKIIGQYNNEGVFAFRESIFNTYILPPIMFSAGFHFKLRWCKGNWRTLLLFVFTLVFVTKIMLSLLVWFAWANVKPDYLSEEKILVGALVCCMIAMDSGALEEAFQERLHLEEAHEPPPIIPLLGMVGVLSSVHAVASFNEVLKEAGDQHELSRFNRNNGELNFMELLLLMVVWTNLSILVASVLGLVVGVASAGYFRLIARMHPHSTSTVESTAAELAGMLFFGWGLFYLSEYFSANFMVDVPGSLAVFVCGLVMGNITWYNCGGITRNVFPVVVKSAAVLGEVYTYGVMGSVFWSLTQGDFTGRVFLSAFVLYLLLWIVRILVLAVTLPVANKLVRPGRHWEAKWRKRDVVAFGWGTTLLGHIAYGLAADTEETLRQDLEPIIWLIVVWSAVVHGSLCEYVVEKFSLVPEVIDSPSSQPTTNTTSRNKVVDSVSKILKNRHIDHFDRAQYQQFSRYVLLAIDAEFNHHQHPTISSTHITNPYQISIKSSVCVNDKPVVHNNNNHQQEEDHEGVEEGDGLTIGPVQCNTIDYNNIQQPPTGCNIQYHSEPMLETVALGELMDGKEDTALQPYQQHQPVSTTIDGTTPTGDPTVPDKSLQLITDLDGTAVEDTNTNVEKRLPTKQETTLTTQHPPFPPPAASENLSPNSNVDKSSPRSTMGKLLDKQGTTIIPIYSASHET